MNRIADIFHVYSGSKLDFGKQELDENGINFVSRNSNNNGIVGKVALTDSMKVFNKGDITVTLGGSYLLSSFVQEEKFVTGQNVAVLRPKAPMSELEKWFYCYALTENRFKFTAFGREVNKYLKDIEVPAKIPDWVHDINIPTIKTDNHSAKALRNIENWKQFNYDDIFIIKNGFYNKKPEQTEEGNIPFLGAVDNNNGVTTYYSINDIENSSKTGTGKNAPISEKIFPANSVAVTNNGSVGFAYFQDTRFTCSHDVNPLYRKDGEFNAYSGLFVATVIMLDRYRWAYGRKWRPSRMINSKITLPATSEGNPDWEYMEDYIQNLPFGDKL